MERKLLVEMVILGKLPRKSNSRRIVRNKKTGKPLIIKSEQALDYTKKFGLQVRNEVKQKFGSLEDPLGLEVVVYYADRRPDLSIELLKDLLQLNDVVKDDRYIRQQACWAFVDKQYPRTELRLYQLGCVEEPPFRLGRDKWVLID